MTIPFYKAHGAGNDFLFTFARDIEASVDFPALAKAICHRNLGVGGDGWYLVDSGVEGSDAAIRLWNSDGSYAELSGNGTRCAAALLVDRGLAPPAAVRIHTGAGPKELTFIRKDGHGYWFEMDMGAPRVEPGQLRFQIPLKDGPRDVTIVDVGNPQCAVVVDSFDFDWASLGAEIERHPFFPNRTNVSFLKRIGDHAIEARFYERGAGHTLSSGTGSAGAAVAALLRGLVSSPVAIHGESLPLQLRRDGATVLLTGPAQLIAEGEFYWSY